MLVVLYKVIVKYLKVQVFLLLVQNQNFLKLAKDQLQVLRMNSYVYVHTYNAIVICILEFTKIIINHAFLHGLRLVVVARLRCISFSKQFSLLQWKVTMKLEARGGSY